MGADRAERSLAAALAGVLTVSAVVMLRQWSAGEGLEVLLPAVWPHLYGAAGAACAWFALQPSSKLAYSLSGSLTVGAFAARAAQFCYILADPSAATHWTNATLAVGAYASLALLVQASWLRMRKRPAHALGN